MGAHCSIAERGKTELSRASEASNQQINPAMPTEGHPYLYTGCNPINLTDSSGLASRDACFAGATSLSVLGLAFAPLPLVGASYGVAAVTVATICYVRGY
jgi:hypothetical protein